MDRDEAMAQELAASADAPPTDSSRLTPAEAVSKQMRTWERAFLREQGAPATEEDLAASQTYKGLVAKLRRIGEQEAQEVARQAALEEDAKEESALEIFLSMPRYANQSRPRRYGIRTELSAAAAAAAERAGDTTGSSSPRLMEAEAALPAHSGLLGFLRPQGRRALAAAMEAVTVPAGKTIYAVGQVGSPPATCCLLPRVGCLCPLLPPPSPSASASARPPAGGRVLLRAAQRHLCPGLQAHLRHASHHSARPGAVDLHPHGMRHRVGGGGELASSTTPSPPPYPPPTSTPKPGVDLPHSSPQRRRRRRAQALLYAMPRAASLSCVASGALWVVP